MQLLGKSEFDIIITEIGGTVGDIESLPYIESVRQLIMSWEKQILVILSISPFLSAAKVKTNL